MSIPKVKFTPKITLHGQVIATGRYVILVRKSDGGENDSFDWFEIVHRIGEETRTIYSDGLWSGCGPVPEDEIHAKELAITPARHRLEHDLWHHLVGIFVYKTLGSPIIWRDAHHIPQPAGTVRELFSAQPTGDVCYEIDGVDITSSVHRYTVSTVWGPCEEEEWLVTALSHHYHDEHSRDHGASTWLANNNHDIEMMLQTAQRILSQIPSD